MSPATAFTRSVVTSSGEATGAFCARSITWPLARGKRGTGAIAGDILDHHTSLADRKTLGIGAPSDITANRLRLPSLLDYR
jgi:hypothetical protein